MDQPRKTDRVGTSKTRTGAKPTSKSQVAVAPIREVRVNVKALVLIGLAAVVIGPGFWGIKALQDRLGRSALLAEARKQRDEARRPDLALSYFNRYLELAPNDLDALDQRATLLASSARDPNAINAAIQAHVTLIGKGVTGPTLSLARKRLASLYLAVSQFRAAEAPSRECLAVNPADLEARRLLARALEGSGRLGDARALEASVAEYQAVEARQPGDVTSAERLAALYLEKFADRPRAVQVLQTMLDHNPTSTEARLARARFFASSGDPRAAAAEIDEALRIDPENREGRLVAAESAARRGDPASARTHLEAIPPTSSDDLRVKIVRGQVELAERKTDEAIRDWKDGLILTGGTDLELTWRLAHVLIQLGRVREAEPLLTQYRRLSGGDEPPPAYRFLAGLANLKSGRTAEAIAEFEAIRYKLDRSLEEPLHLALGQAYELALDPNKAADAYNRATSTPGAHAAPWLALARLQAADRPSEFRATLERGLASIGPDERLLTELARALWREQAAVPLDRRNWDELNRVLDQGRQVAPGSVDLLMVQADLMTSLGRPEEGLAALEGATRRDPMSAAAWLAQVEVLARLSRLDEALSRLDQAVLAAGDQASFRVARARFALQKGEVKAARASLAEGLDRVPSPQRSLLWKALGEFHQTQGDRVAARAAFLEWSALESDALEPHLALLGLATETGDDRAIDREVDALKAIGGPRNLYWKVARAEAILRDRPGSPPPSPARLDEAESLVAEIEASSPTQPTGPLLEARLRERRHQPERAIQAYDRALERKAGPLTLKPLVALLAKLGRFDELEALRARLGGFSPEVDRMAGALALRDGTPEKAEELARRMVAGDPAGLDARAWQARILGEVGKSAEAESSLLQLAERQPERPAPWVQLLMFQVARGNRAGASTTIERMKARVQTDRPELLWALCYRVSNLTPEADRAFDRALQVHPDELATLQSAIDYYEVTGRPERAEPLLRRAWKANPRLDWVRRRLALNLAARPGDRAAWQEALRLAGEASDASDTPDDRLTRAVVLSLGSEARRGEAVVILEALAIEMPENTRVREALARAWLAVGNTVRAREHASRSARSSDASPDAIRLAASLDLASGDPDSAARQLDRLRAIGLDAPNTLDLRARVLKAQGKPGEAVALVEKAYDEAEKGSGGLDFGRAMIRLLVSLDDSAAAERLARRVARLGPLGTIVLAEFLGSQNRFDESRPLYEATASDPPSAREAARSVLALAAMTREPRWVDLADRLLDRAISTRPDDTELAYGRASLRHLQGQLEEAVRLYDDLASRSTANLLFLNNAAWILSEELGRPQEGLTRIETLIARSGVQPHTLDTRGVILIRLGQTSRAIDDLEAASGAIPSGPICFHLARAYLAAGRQADAARIMARASLAGLKPESLQPSERGELARVESVLK